MNHRLKISLILFFCLLVCSSYGQYDFQADKVSGCDSLIGIKFWLETPPVSDSIVFISWDFEGAEPAFYPSFDKTDTILVNYNDTGSYRVFVSVQFNITDTTIDKVDYINVNKTVSAEYAFKDTLEVDPYSVVFRDITELYDSVGAYSFDWDFDDGTFDSGRTVVHTFPGAAAYNVSLTVTDIYGCTDSYVSSVATVEPPPPYEIIASESKGCDSLHVKFTWINNTYVDTVTTIFWDFGNGETSTSFDPDTVTYYPGTYSLNYIMNGGTDNILIDTIQVYTTVDASFIYSDTAEIAPFSMVFRNNTVITEPPATYSYDWDFGDGDADTGTRVVHTFLEANTYSVSLDVTDNFGCSDTQITDVIVAAQPYEVSMSETEGCDSVLVKFGLINNTPVDTVSTIYWDFGNGETSSSFDPDTVTYYPGIYTVNFILNGGTDNILQDTIKVYRTARPSFVYSDTSEIAQYAVVFRDNSVLYEPAASYNFGWDFDDGETGTGMTVIHTFSAPATYNVSHTVTDSHGCSATQAGNVNIAPPGPQADITASAVEGCDSLKVKCSLVNVDTDTITSVAWDFGNGITSNQIDPDTVLFVNPDRAMRRYEITAIINGDSANAVTRNDLFTVYRTVRADFRCADTLTSDQSINKVCWNIDRMYNDSSSYEFLWNFEGKGDITDRRPLLTFPLQNDTIDAQLTITDLTYGCSDTYNGSIILAELLVIQNFFSPNDDNIFDEFVIDGGSIPLHIKIFSRTGALVYEAKGLNIIRWNGTTQSGHKLKTGVYFYILKAVEGDPGERFTKQGFVHLFR
jgi:gliding motility-associated-like protein